jgi:hypothetical protein
VPLLLLVVGGKQDEDLAVRAALRHPIESGFSVVRERDEKVVLMAF